MKRLILILALSISSVSLVKAQSFGTCDCSASISGTKDFTAISWTGTGCPTSSTTSYTGNLCVSMANGSTLNLNSDFTLTGNFKIVNSGTNANVYVPSTNSFHVTGNMGYTSNNNIDYTIDGTLTVDGTLVGKNQNGLMGSGTLNAGTVSMDQNATAATTLTYHVTNCVSTTAGFCTTVLPITLESFTSTVKENAVQLDWATSSEINFNYFSLQRSTNGKDYFEIDQVKGHGTTNDRHEYQFVDHSPFIGLSHYRLTSNDFDGYKETFSAISVVYHGEKKFTVSPNPSEGASVDLNFNFSVEEDGMVTVYDNVGSVVGHYSVNGGTITFANPLKSGVYLAKYSSSSTTKTDRFMVK